MKKIQVPLNSETIEELKAGEEVLITGVVYTLRDAAHKKIFDLINNGSKLPLKLKNQVLYYCGLGPVFNREEYTLNTYFFCLNSYWQYSFYRADETIKGQFTHDQEFIRDWGQHTGCCQNTYCHRQVKC